MYYGGWGGVHITQDTNTLVFSDPIADTVPGITDSSSNYNNGAVRIFRWNSVAGTWDKTSHVFNGAGQADGLCLYDMLPDASVLYIGPSRSPYSARGLGNPTTSDVGVYVHDLSLIHI